jgi:outer membrane murein-binding lipoprotein Lpp
MRLTRQCLLSTLVAILLCAVLSTSAFAQAGGAGPGGGGQGGPPRFDPAQFRQMMMDRLREQLKASDDEWAVLGPKIEKVMQAQQNSMGGGMGMGMLFGGGRGPGGPGGPGGGGENPSPVAKASRELQTAVQDGNAAPADLKRKMTALREARDAAKKELADAQKALLDVLSPQQEAVMLAVGFVQ